MHCTPHVHPNQDKIVKFVQHCDVKAVCFDLNGVLLGSHRLVSMEEVHISSALSFLIHNLSIPERSKFFDSLRVPQLQRDTDGSVTYHKGIELPSILTHFHMGRSSGEEAERDIIAYYDSPECPLNKSEKTFFLNVAHLMLDAETFVRTRKRLERGLHLADTLAERYPTLVLCGISNWDETSGGLMREKFPDVFERFRFVILSGEVDAVKPGKKIFDLLLERVREIIPDAEMADLMLIDDEDTNVQEAIKFGMRGWRYDPEYDGMAIVPALLPEVKADEKPEK